MDICDTVFYNGPHRFAKAHWQQLEHILGIFLYVQPTKWHFSNYKTFLKQTVVT